MDQQQYKSGSRGSEEGMSGRTGEKVRWSDSSPTEILVVPRNAEQLVLGQGFMIGYVAKWSSAC